jgi:hypothetical protein
MHDRRLHGVTADSYTDVRIRKYRDAKTHACARGMQICADAQMQGCTDTLMRKDAGRTQAGRLHGVTVDSSTDIRIRNGGQLPGRTDLEVQGCTDTRMSTHAGMHDALMQGRTDTLMRAVNSCTRDARRTAPRTHELADAEEHGHTHAQGCRDAQRTAARGNGEQLRGRTNPDVQECTDTRMSTHAGLHRYSDAGAHRHTHARCGLL